LKIKYKLIITVSINKENKMKRKISTNINIHKILPTITTSIFRSLVIIIRS